MVVSIIICHSGFSAIFTSCKLCLVIPRMVMCCLFVIKSCPLSVSNTHETSDRQFFLSKFLLVSMVIVCVNVAQLSMIEMFIALESTTLIFFLLQMPLT